AAMSPILVMAHLCQEDRNTHVSQALKVIDDGLSLCSKLGCRHTEAELYLKASEISLKEGLLDDTLEKAQRAVIIFRDLEDWRGEETANAVLGEVYTRRRQPELAPHRREALELAHTMARALDLRDSPGFYEAAERFGALGVSLPPVSKKEQMEIFGPVLKKDPDGAAAFIQTNVPQESSSLLLQSLNMGVTFADVDKKAFYQHYRAGGIAYGPRFRCVDYVTGRQTSAQRHEDEALAYAVYTLQEGSDEWERGYRNHPAILDAAFQSTSVLSTVFTG
ncbi:unnamed protein product, partial [Polarella glacialis]